MNVGVTERIIEALAYKSKRELEKKLFEEPLVCIGAASPDESRLLATFVKHLTPFFVSSQLKEKNINLGTLQELTAKQNKLDFIIQSEYNILHSNFSFKEEGYDIRFETGQQASCQTLTYQYSEIKKLHVMQKTGDARLSDVNIILRWSVDGSDFRSFYAKASIRGGPLAEENSALAKQIVNYWRSNDLLIINNYFFEEEEKKGRIIKGTYVRGCVKALAFEEQKESMEEEFQKKFGRKLPLSLISE
ncbi:hypothetical protein JW756_00805 [Candidatus Woesearchaeota archaeon]|nr:hypothetical protein [Candidatus Woesearchaeota archaeon]